MFNNRPFNSGRSRGPFRQSNRGPRRAVKNFDPRNVIEKFAQDIEPEVAYVSQNSFSDFKISEKLKETILKRGYETPTPIQDQIIPHILEGKDVVGIANTGTGKTAAFLIPLIDKVLRDNKNRVLIVAPTRELAVQIEKELESFAKSLGISSVICIGGVSIVPQKNRLYRKPNFVIGTPGRLIDLYEQRSLNFYDFSTIVLDEVDRMLDMGFIISVNRIISSLPPVRQSMFFSATLDEKTKPVMAKFIKNPILVSVKSRDTSINIHQEVIEVKGRNKADVLSEILDKREVEKSIVFVRTKRGADNLSRSLYSIGFKTAVLHGNKTQNQRQKSLEQFRVGSVNILIATDVASRGIDIQDISHVINFDLPETYEDYIHRIGRTGRADKKGIALSLI